MKNKRKPKTIGQMTQRRGEWLLNPVTRVKVSDKAYDRSKEKQKIRKGEY